MADPSGGTMPRGAGPASEIPPGAWQGSRDGPWAGQGAPGLVLISFHAFVAPDSHRSH